MKKNIPASEEYIIFNIFTPIMCHKELKKYGCQTCKSSLKKIGKNELWNMAQSGIQPFVYMVKVSFNYKLNILKAIYRSKWQLILIIHFIKGASRFMC